MLLASVVYPDALEISTHSLCSVCSSRSEKWDERNVMHLLASVAADGIWTLAWNTAISYLLLVMGSNADWPKQPEVMSCINFTSMYLCQWLCSSTCCTFGVRYGVFVHQVWTVSCWAALDDIMSFAGKWTQNDYFLSWTSFCIGISGTKTRVIKNLQNFTPS